jgi:rhodanese-related sulfurtransferase
MGRITEILNTAQQRGGELKLPYAGAVLPHEAAELLQLAPGAVMVDVRSRPELDLNGAIPGVIHVEWRTWPGWVANPHFIPQLRQLVDVEALLMFICRNGARSHQAAVVCSEAGFASYNVLEGFEGDLNKASGRRNELNGWKLRDLPWTQS